jgi:hypothetical protein
VAASLVVCLVVGKREEVEAVAFAVDVKVALRAVGEEASGAAFWVASLVVDVKAAVEAAVLVVEPWVDSSEVRAAGS